MIGEYFPKTSQIGCTGAGHLSIRHYTPLIRHAKHNSTTKAETMKIKVTSRTRTSDPITYDAFATVTIPMLVGEKVFTGDYGGDENDSRQEVKAEAKRLAIKAAGHWAQ